MKKDLGSTRKKKQKKEGLERIDCKQSTKIEADKDTKSKVKREGRPPTQSENEGSFGLQV